MKHALALLFLLIFLAPTAQAHENVQSDVLDTLGIEDARVVSIHRFDGSLQPAATALTKEHARVLAAVLQAGSTKVPHVVFFEEPTCMHKMSVWWDELNGSDLTLAINTACNKNNGVFVGRMIHEVAHIAYRAEYEEVENDSGCIDMGTYAADSERLLERFRNTFWAHCDEAQPQLQAFSAERFVHPHSVIHVEEDLTNTFAAFVLCPLPGSDAIQNERRAKLDFFWGDAAAVEWRTRIRTALGTDSLAAAQQAFSDVCALEKVS